MQGLQMNTEKVKIVPSGPAFMIQDLNWHCMMEFASKNFDSRVLTGAQLVVMFAIQSFKTFLKGNKSARHLHTQVCTLVCWHLSMQTHDKSFSQL